MAPAGPKILDDFWHFGTWVLVKIPLSFHYTGWFIGISRSWIINIPNILGSIIPQLIINPARGLVATAHMGIGQNGISLG